MGLGGGGWNFSWFNGKTELDFFFFYKSLTDKTATDKQFNQWWIKQSMIDKTLTERLKKNKGCWKIKQSLIDKTAASKQINQGQMKQSLVDKTITDR